MKRGDGAVAERVFNFAYRVVGSGADAAEAVQRAFLGTPWVDGEAARRADLFAATRSACYELMHARRPTRPDEAEADPDGPQAELRRAAMCLPEHQREALALRELEGMSYDEIATIMEIGAGSVAQLISRGRINLHDELHGNVLASVAAPSPECERALPLIAMREDGQLDAASRDAAWLDAHLAGCSRCELGVEVMQEAASSYRGWVPLAAAPWLSDEAMAMATGNPTESRPDAARADRRRALRAPLPLVAGLAALLLLAGVATAVIGGDDPPAAPTGAKAGAPPRDDGAAPGAGAKAGKKERRAARRRAAKRKSGRRTANTTAAAQSPAAPTSPASSAPSPTPVTTGGGAPSASPSRPDRPAGKTGVQATQPTAAPKPAARPKPAPAPPPASEPSAAPAPTAPATTEEPPAVEEPPEESSRRREPPGKPADRPPK